MPEDIERTIFQLEFESGEFINRVNSAAASLTRLNDTLLNTKIRFDTNQVAFKQISERVLQLKKDVDTYTGSNEKYRLQLENDLKDAQKEQEKLAELIKKTQEEYEAAKKAAQDFADASQGAIRLQETTTGGKITPIEPIQPTVIPPPPAPEIQPVVTDIEAKLNLGDLKEMPIVLGEIKEEFDHLAEAIDIAEERMRIINHESQEFKKLSEFVSQGKKALQEYYAATGQSATGTIGLRQQIEQAEKKLAELAAAGKQGTEEFIKLQQSITAGKFQLAGIENFVRTLDEGDEKARGFSTQIRELKNEMALLQQTGKGDTEEFKKLETQVAHLTKAYRDQQERIKILSSETRALDFGKSAIQGAIQAFQGYLAVTILVGEKDEELQKKTMQLFAAMQLLTSLEGIYNTLKKNSVIFTNLQSAAQGVYTFAINASTAALRAFRIALILTGVGAAAVLIGVLVKKYLDHAAAVKKAKEEQEFYNEIIEEAGRASAGEVAHLEIIRAKLSDLSIPQKKRIELAKEYNKTADEGNKLDITQIDNIDLLNAAIDRQIKQIERRAKAKAAENAITKQYEKIFDEQEKAIERADKAADKFISSTITRTEQTRIISDQAARKPLTLIEPVKIPAPSTTTPELTPQEKADLEKSSKESQEKRKQFIDKFIETDPALNKANEELKTKLRVALGFIDIDSLLTETKTPTKTTPTTRTIQNEFEKRKAELDKRLRELLRGEIDTIEKIKSEFEDKLNEARADIDKATKEGRLLPEQGEILKAEAKTINTVELEKAIAIFQKRVIDARKKIEDEIKTLQQKSIQDSLQLLQDEFDRRAKLIQFNEEKELSDSKDAVEKRIEALNLQRLLIGEEAYQTAKAQIITNGEQAAINIIQKYAQEREKLAADIYKKSLDAYQEAIFQGDLVRSESAAKELRLASDKFLAGTISWTKYQKEITRIQKEEEAIRRDATLDTLRTELADIDRQLAKIKDHYSAVYKELKKIRDELFAKILSLETADAGADASDRQAIIDARVKAIEQYTQAIGSLIQATIEFWAKANEAESAALDRSIALQERRVDAARRIAERGNAEYLQQEEDRLKELEIKRENAARRQLAIDAAMQASQVLVGITGAIAKIASGPLGAAETIAEIAIIIGALATGYALVKSLQGNQPKLAKGTPYLKRDREPAGVDTIPAWLNEGEAIIPTEKNRKYDKAVQAIYYGKVPAEAMNKFVENYVTNKTTEKYITNTTNEVSAKNKISSENQNEVFRHVEPLYLSGKAWETVRDTTTTNLEIYKNFVSNVSKVPEKVISNYVNNYEESRMKILEEKIKTVPTPLLEKFVENYNNSKLENIIHQKTTVDEKLKLINKSDSKTLIEKVKEIPVNIISAFIKSYEKERHYFKGTTDLKRIGEPVGVDTIRVMANEGEAIIPTVINKRYNETVKAIYNQTIPPEKLNTFVKTYHSVKPLPIPHFQKIKEATVTKVSYDGKLAQLISEQNKMLAENNDLQRITIRALKSMGVNVNVDKNGLALSVMEVVEQIKIDKRV